MTFIFPPVFFSAKLLWVLEKNTNFAVVIELKRHIEILLLSNDCVIVPDFGGFMAHHVEARYDGSDYTFLPPLRTIGFNPQLRMNDSLLAQSYVEAYDISYPEAINRIAEEVTEIRQTLESKGKFDLADIGTIFLNEDGNYTFEPCEAGILTPDYYGLDSINIRPLSLVGNMNIGGEEVQTKTVTKREVKEGISEAKNGTNAMNTNSVFDYPTSDMEEKRNAEFIQIRKSLLRNIAAACIAIIVFFALSTPLGTPNVQKSQIDTGMLYRIMPKDITKGKMDSGVSLTSAATRKTEKVEMEAEEKATILSGKKTYYSIVLASRVTKRNAERFVDQLHQEGLQEAKVYQTASNVKVVFGSYDSESEAYRALNQRQDMDVFVDGWITKIKE